MIDGKVNKLIYISLMAALSLGIYALESLIGPIAPIPGIKLGLSNVIVLICLYVINARAALAVLMIRIVISSILFANPVAMVYGIAGGVLSFIAEAFLKSFFHEKNIWALSVIGALFHNFGQVLAASIILGDSSVWYYFLFLVISSVITGVFTGICAGSAIGKINKIKFGK